jgi:hypothetical protein
MGLPLAHKQLIRLKSVFQRLYSKDFIPAHAHGSCDCLASPKPEQQEGVAISKRKLVICGWTASHIRIHEHQSPSRIQLPTCKNKIMHVACWQCDEGKSTYRTQNILFLSSFLSLDTA